MLTTSLETRWALLYCLVVYMIAGVPSCKQSRTLSGKRLLEARSYFGKVMKDCSKELAKMASLTPKGGVSQRVSAYCAAYDSCVGEAGEKIKQGVTQKPQQMILECGLRTTQNKSSQFYTELGDSENLMNAVYEGLVCFNRTGIMDLPMETIDDIVTVTKRFFLTFG